MQLAAAKALDEGDDVPKEMSAIYQRRRDLVVDALREIGVDVPAHEGHDLRLGARCRTDTPPRRTASWCSRSRAWWSRRAARTGPNGEGFFRISLTIGDDRLTEAVERMRSSLAKR